MTAVSGDENDPLVAAVHGSHGANGAGVFGESKIGPGVLGISSGTDPNQRGFGVFGSAIGTAIVGESQTFIGVFGLTSSVTGGSGVMGRSTTAAAGVNGESAGGPGVMGSSTGTDPNQLGVGVFGKAIGSAIVGESENGFGLFARTQTGEAAIRGDNEGDGFGGFFTGHVGVTRELRVNESIHALGGMSIGGDIFVRGDIQLVGADLAEEFCGDGDDIEPGCVVVATGLDLIEMCATAYDRRVAGVVSGAGSCRAALVLDRRVDSDTRWPVALAGKVWCRVDATDVSIEVGDPLTTAPIAGYAMRATDPVRAFGAVLGKALAPLASGRGLIPVLVTLN